MKKTFLIICFFILLLPLTASAYAVKSGNSVYVPKGETIEGNLYAAGSTITIDGKVTGDVYCAGQSVNINGQVDGDVNCAGQSVNINGAIGGSLRSAGNSLSATGKVSRNAMLFGATITTTASSSVGWEMLVAGGSADIFGNIGRDLYGSAGQATIAGQIGQNVKLNLGGQNKKSDATALTIASTAKINGNVTYTSANKAAIESGSVIKGKLMHNLPAAKDKKTRAFPTWGWGNLIGIFSALVIGLVMVSFWREKIIKLTDLMLARSGASLGWGILALLLTPIIVVILLITIIGLPLALILTALWLIALYVSKILVGVLVGRSLFNNFWLKQKDNLTLAMIVGVIISYLIFSLPFIGWIVSLLAIVWGLGGIALAFKNK